MPTPNSNYFLRIILCTFLLVIPSSVASATEEKANKIMLFLNSGEYDKAKEVLDKAIHDTPNSVPVLYQQARYYMKTEFQEDNSIIGFNYSNLTENASVDSLEKLLSIDPNYGEAYSLLGHIYAVQGNTLEAERQFANAEKLSPRPVWLDYNKGLLALQKEEFKKASNIFQKHTSRLNKRSNTKKMRDAYASIYSASWSMLRNLSVKHPEFDPVDSIQKGLIKRVNPKDFSSFIKTSKNNHKKLYVHFTSSDEFCKPCAKNNKKVEVLAKKHGDKYDFIHVSFEPWTDIKYYSLEIAKPIMVTGLPFQVVYDQAAPILYKSAGICDCSFDQMLNGTFERIDPSRNNIKIPDKSDVMGSINYYFKNHVATEKHYKAFAVVIDGDYWQTGMSRKRLSQELANRKALEQCEYEKNKTGKTKNACQLFGVGNKGVFGLLDDEINQITIDSAQQKLSPIDKIIANYKRQKKVKALAIAVDQYHHWNTFYFTDAEEDCQYLEECKEKVLKNCNESRKRWNTTTPCQIYFENNIQVKEFVLPKFK